MRDQGTCMVTPVSGEADNGPNETGKRKVRDDDSAVHHLLVLLASERAYKVETDYLAQGAAASVTGAISEPWRRKLVEWCFEVADHFGFDREVVNTAINYLDRAVCHKTQTSETPVVKRDFQLMAVTSLYIAIKTHGQTESFEGPRRKLKIDAFVQLSRGVFTVETIEATERQILTDLKWRMNPPTNLRFISYLLRLLPRWSNAGSAKHFAQTKSMIYEVSRYLAELSVCVSHFSFSYNSSTVAYASILCAMEILQNKSQIPPIPYEARVNFLNTMAETCGIFPESPEVRRCRAALKALCPEMFESDELPPEFQRADLVEDAPESEDEPAGGKSSPVCVADHYSDSPNSRRKRSRTSA
mmetsp:Transcript_22981/g.63973  ORF Transcript_22981/g.63973 Transcript_22981/m.63973 type:complete len:358 (+) Transcript_22981:43-1116(+)